MATDHKGRTVGNPNTGHGGHRPTPRLALLMAHEMGNPRNKKFLYGSIPPEYREETAQNMINLHREGVAKGLGGSEATPLISQVIKNRGQIQANIDDYYDTGVSKYLGDDDTDSYDRGDDGLGSYLFDHPDEPEKRI
jgi:hypothetical protein